MKLDNWEVKKLLDILNAYNYKTCGKMCSECEKRGVCKERMIVKKLNISLALRKSGRAEGEQL